MKKTLFLIISIILSIPLILSYPIIAQDNISNAYLNVLENAIRQYGEYSEDHHGCCTSGIGYVNIIDLNNDEIPELIFCCADNQKDFDYIDYIYYIYTYKNGTSELLTKDSMEAHCGQANWEISLWHSNGNTVRVSKSRYTDIACESEYITFYEYDGNSWLTYPDSFASVAVETEPGIYYFKYIIHGQEVSKEEYNNRLNSLSRNGFTSINSKDFSDTYLDYTMSVLKKNNYNTSYNNYQEKIRLFGRTQFYNNIVYTTPLLYNDGNVSFAPGNVPVQVIPVSSNNIMIYGFSIYNNKIYYLSGAPASDSARATIYECNLDGSNTRLISDNAYNYSNCFICGDYIYYDTYDNINTNNKSIYRVNVNNSIYQKIVYRNNVHIGLVDGTYIYYSDETFNYSCLLDGSMEQRVGERDDRCGALTSPQFTGNPNTQVFYCISEGYIYEVKMNEYESKPIATARGNAHLLDADNYAIYYADIVPAGNSSTAYVYRCEFENIDEDDVDVIINNEKISFEQKPVIINGRTLVPMRKIFEHLGATVEWDGEEEKITAFLDDIKIILKIGSDQIVRNGITIKNDSYARLISDTTYVPIRVITESFNSKIDWDEITKSIIINHPLNHIPVSTPTPSKLY